MPFDRPVAKTLTAYIFNSIQPKVVKSKTSNSRQAVRPKFILWISPVCGSFTASLVIDLGGA